MEGFFTVRNTSFGSGRGNHTKGSSPLNTAPNAPDLTEGCRHSSRCWVRLLHALSKTSPKYSKCQHCQVLHTVLYSGVVQEVNTSGYTCFLLKVLLQAGSHHTRAHPTHKCSYHSTECRLWMVKSAFPFFGQLQKLKPKVSKNGRQTPIRSTTSVPQSGTAILGDDTELSLALHRDHQHSGVTHRAAIKQI